MKLTGNKRIILTIGFAAASATALAANEPTLTTFTSGTPAKAQEVNANFEASVNYTTRSAAELTLKLEAVEKADTESAAGLLAQIEALKTRLSALDGQGGKAEEFTQVFNELDDRVDVLEAKVQALEAQSNHSGDEYNIAVWGDCNGECTDDNLIGYTNGPTDFLNQRIYAKTKYGSVRIQAGYSQDEAFVVYDMDQFGERTRDGSYPLYFADSSCQQAVLVLSTGDGSPFVFVDSESHPKINTVIPTSHNNTKKLFTIAESAEVNQSQTQFYQLNESDICASMDWEFSAGSFSIPLSEIQDLKATYSNIKIEGYTQL